MKYVYAIIAVIIIGILIYVFWPQNELKDIDVTQLTSLKNKIYKAETLRQIVIIKAKKDSAKHAEIIQTKDAEINRLKVVSRKYRQATVRIDTVIANEPEIGIYLQYVDSIVVAQDSAIVELKQQTRDQWQSFNQLIHASDSASDAHKELNKAFQSSIESQLKENKKLRRQNAALKIGIVAIPVGIVALVVDK